MVYFATELPLIATEYNKNTYLKKKFLFEMVNSHTYNLDIFFIFVAYKNK